MLEAVGLTKRYSSIPAVQSVSFQIRRGQILGYLGPNGSGKSTTVKMLTGLIEPSDGKILFDGVKVHGGNPFFARILGYVPEEPQVYSHLTGPEYLRLVGRLETRTLTEKGFASKSCVLEPHGIGTLRFSVCSIYQVLIRMASDQRTMRSGPGPTFTCSNQRL